MSALVSVHTPTDEETDQDLAARVHRQFASDSRALSRLQIEVDCGVVTLRGTATSFYQKQLWLHGAKRVVGDSALINDEIDVTFNLDVSDVGWRD
jgi:hypothetical protein